MAPFTADEIRSAFLRFFRERGHTVVRSSSLVPQNDPTLLFTNAGMNQFKDVFTGREKRPYTRAASSQKCVRAGGKHNDLENVGFTARHHTFFEMLGNFSFGDYFKKDAVAWGWEFVAGVLALPKERLAVTVFEGDESVPGDDEAAALWLAQGVRPERLFRLGRKDNFWQMGETGPCGPCTEMHVYRGDLKGEAEIDAHARDFFAGRLGDTDDWMEIWNLVFMQFERFADGRLVPLPRPSVDTGAGLERMAAAVQNVASNYDTDLLRGLCLKAAELAGTSYPGTAASDASVRVVADHARATAFLVADGVMPSNEGRGYVLRRIMRRAIRHGKRLGVDRLFFDEVCAKVVETMGAQYPELREHAAFIREVVRNEEEGFRRTLNRGLALLEDYFEQPQRYASMVHTFGSADVPDVVLQAQVPHVIPGEVVFKLYDTYGFPDDLTRVIAAERGFDIDEAGFQTAMAKQRERSAFGGSGESAVGDLWKTLAGELPATNFLGYEAERATARVQRIVVDGTVVANVGATTKFQVVFDSTPLYAESGGQLGDTGTMQRRGLKARITDVKKLAGLFVHDIELTEGLLDDGDEVELIVDHARRNAIRANHSATHLLHHALRSLLGEHVKQAGSVVAPDYLRFDYAHFAPLTDEQTREVERRVNAMVRENHAAHTDVLDLDEAKARGAIAFFGEKYGARVRMVGMGPSVELCGGTHVARTGDVGFFKITGESAIAAGVRRIVAVTGPEAVALVHDEERALSEAAALLKAAPRDVRARTEALVGRVRELEKELESIQKAAAAAKSGDLAGGAREVKDVKVLAVRHDGDSKTLRELADKLRDRLGRGVVVLGAQADGKALVLVAVTQDLAAKMPAKVVLDELTKTMGGRGGGKPDMAQAGGGDPAKLDQALAMVYGIVESRL